MLLAQKKAVPGPKTINEAIRLFSELADLDFEPGYDDHIYFQYLSNNKNNISLLEAYHSEEIYSKYIIRVAGKGFMVVDHPSEVYGFPDIHECIDGNLPLRLVLNIDARQYSDLMNPELPSLDKYKISRKDLLSRILIACTDIINSDLNYFIILNTFALASSSNANKCNKTALSVRASQVTTKYGWFEIGNIRKGFVNFQARSLEACPICNIKHKRDQLYGFLLKDGCFVLKCYWQKQYKPDHRELAFKGASDIIKLKEKPKQKIVDRMANVILNSLPLPELSGRVINIEEIEDFPEAYSNFLSKEPSTTLIRSPMMTGKTKGLRKYLNSLTRSKASLPCILWISYQKTLSNESQDKWDIIIVQVENLSHIEFLARLIVAILDETNAINRQMSSGANA
ncbi:hypothetical protein C1645_840624 [Glomus cerebriforme]|uniref:Replication origin-binding protein domain-containing protein n=1 Tax=Glomus cerebriforme TaxID=658196 RepID=A0A397RZ03_9GLOM|nr:hypothetical protein C1645_840624 [Glomus cerebriforme]